MNFPFQCPSYKLTHSLATWDVTNGKVCGVARILGPGTEYFLVHRSSDTEVDLHLLAPDGSGIRSQRAKVSAARRAGVDIPRPFPSKENLAQECGELLEKYLDR